MSSIDLEKIGQQSLEAVVECLETMVGITDIEVGSVEVLDAVERGGEANSFIGFGGSHVGGLGIESSRALAGHIACQMLCAEDPSELSDDEIRDAFGEINNMTAGGLKTRCEANGISFEITVPMIVMGEAPVDMHCRESGPVACVSVKINGESLRVLSTCSPASS